VDSLQAQMRQLIPGETIGATISNESIVLSGLVASADAANRAVQLARTFAGDKVVNLISVGSSQQVMLEVRFAEVSRSVGKDIGVRTSVTSATGAFGAAVGPGSTAAGGSSQTNSVATNGVTSNSSNNNSNTSTSNNSANASNTASSGTSNSSALTTNLSISGQTAPFSGTATQFNNLGTLNGQTFTGTGNAGYNIIPETAGAGLTTSNGTSSSTTSTSTAGTALNSIGALTTALAGSVASSVVTTTNTLGSLLQIGNITNSFGIFQQRYSIGGLTLQSMLNAMETKGQAKTLAQPTLMALSGEKASFLAGGEFPIPVAQSSNGNGAANAITIEFKQFGVSLAFTPTVLGDKTINLIVEPEVSQIDPSASIVLNGITIPGLRTRRASTTLELRDGESFAIAGLISKDFQTSVSQVPLLGSIPILGALFRSSSFQKGETELLIVVTPHLVAPLRPGQVVLPTDRVGDPRETDLFLLGKDYRPQEIGQSAPPAPQGAPAATQPAKKEDGYGF
jgi:Flp pilus assembly secretin CpaC